MRRIIFSFLVFIIIFSLTSCSGQDTGSQKGREYTADNFEVSEDFEIITEKDTYSTDVEEINFTITNKSDKACGYDEEIRLSKYVDGEWKIVSWDKEVIISELMFLIKPNSTNPSGMTLKNYFNYPLEPGLYRLVKPNFARSNTFTIE